MNIIEIFEGGVWWTENGELHLDIPMLLRLVGLPDTKENRDLAVKVALEVVASELPGIPTEVKE